MPELLDPAIAKILKKDQHALAQTEVPIITVSATFQEDLKKFYGFPDNETDHDIVFSRAHYSMALGMAVEAWGVKQATSRDSQLDHYPFVAENVKVDPKKAWIVDPTNYVSHEQFSSIGITQTIGETLARYPLLKKIKDFVDKFGRNKLPIIDAITPSLLYLAKDIKRPILSFHIVSGNVLHDQGKTIVQMITDPHVRYDYLENADSDRMYYLVFDEATKLECIEKAALLEKKLDPDRVIVTGPPVDPRIVAARKSKRAWRSGTLKLCLTTGGLGTNKVEIEKILEQLLPVIRRDDMNIKLLVFAATHDDIRDLVGELAKKHRVKLGNLTDSRADLRVLYHPQVVDANELLIRYGFPWADGFITKPSGDMTYDAVAAGCFVLTLEEWGEWEHRIREIFSQKGIARELIMDDVVAQIKVLMSATGQAESWIEKAMTNALTIDKLFINGAEQIISAYKKIAKE